MNQREALEILELSSVSDQREVRKAYAALSRRYHPEDAPQEWQKIHEAYQFLTAISEHGGQDSREAMLQRETVRQRQTTESPSGQTGEADGFWKPEGEGFRYTAGAGGEPERIFEDTEGIEKPQTEILRAGGEELCADRGFPGRESREDREETLELTDMFDQISELSQQKEAEESAYIQEKLERTVKALQILFRTKNLEAWKQFFWEQDREILCQAAFLEKLGSQLDRVCVSERLYQELLFWRWQILQEYERKCQRNPDWEGIFTETFRKAETARRKFPYRASQQPGKEPLFYRRFTPSMRFCMSLLWAVWLIAIISKLDTTRPDTSEAFQTEMVSQQIQNRQAYLEHLDTDGFHVLNMHLELQHLSETEATVDMKEILEKHAKILEGLYIGKGVQGMEATEFWFREFHPDDGMWEELSLEQPSFYRAVEIKEKGSAGIYLLFLNPEALGFKGEVKIYCTDRNGSVQEVREEAVSGTESSITTASSWRLAVKDYYGLTISIPDGEEVFRILILPAA